MHFDRLSMNKLLNLFILLGTMRSEAMHPNTSLQRWSQQWHGLYPTRVYILGYIRGSSSITLYIV